MIKNIFVGKADIGYCVDIQCNQEHNGEKCCCDNLAITKKQDEALRIGIRESTKYNVPLITEWDRKTKCIK